MKETAENVDEAVRELPDANMVRLLALLKVTSACGFEVLRWDSSYQFICECAETGRFVGKPLEGGSSETPPKR